MDNLDGNLYALKQYEDKIQSGEDNYEMAMDFTSDAMGDVDEPHSISAQLYDILKVLERTYDLDPIEAKDLLVDEIRNRL